MKLLNKTVRTKHFLLMSIQILLNYQIKIYLLYLLYRFAYYKILKYEGTQRLVVIYLTKYTNIHNNYYNNLILSTS